MQRISVSFRTEVYAFIEYTQNTKTREDANKKVTHVQDTMKLFIKKETKMYFCNLAIEEKHAKTDERIVKKI